MKEMQPLVADLDLCKQLQRADIQHYGALYWFYCDNDDKPTAISYWDVVYIPWADKQRAIKEQLIPAYTAQDLVYALPANISFEKREDFTIIDLEDRCLTLNNDTNLASLLARTVLLVKK